MLWLSKGIRRRTPQRLGPAGRPEKASAGSTYESTAADSHSTAGTAGAGRLPAAFLLGLGDDFSRKFNAAFRNFC
jgi:hypothetical protein